MDDLFQDCVDILRHWADVLGMTYEEINIWIFLIIEPVIFIAMCLWIIHREIGRSNPCQRRLVQGDS